MEESKAGQVYYYRSAFLKKENDVKHYHPVVLDIMLGTDGQPKKILLIITTHTKEKEEDIKKKDGNDGYVILEPKDYRELAHTSIISGKIYEEDSWNLKERDRKSDLPEETLQKIRQAAKENRQNKEYIRRLL